MSIERKVDELYNIVKRIRRKENQLIIIVYDDIIYLEQAKFEHDYSAGFLANMKVITYNSLKTKIEECEEEGEEFHGKWIQNDKNIKDYEGQVEVVIKKLSEKLRCHMKTLYKTWSKTIYWLGNEIGEEGEDTTKINWKYEENRMYSSLVKDIIFYFEHPKEAYNLKNEKILTKIELCGDEIIRFFINDNDFEDNCSNDTNIRNPTIYNYEEKESGRKNIFKLMCRILEKLKTEPLLEKYIDKKNFQTSVRELQSEYWYEGLGYLEKFAKENIELTIDEYMEKEAN